MTDDMSSAAGPAGPLLVLPFPDGERVVVLLSGEADLSTAAVLREELERSLAFRAPSLVIDARELTFCDLSGLDALHDAVDVAEQSGVTVTLRPSAQLRWLVAVLAGAPTTGGRARRDPRGRPLPTRTRPTA